ncbi:hypothetical protein FB561_4937 [Kribbella amoyensis]|uniref:DUF4440 domain-containing protein n=1 Tax=Kribbella amoyensis TaxID=996641 RepID=A0A561BY55_9ACTN|nr:hypothetical protein [Kribbella amoyensis]TWD83768.1 hypothetical protein FB561_4937 [Kribbella amoyensis]
MTDLLEAEVRRHHDDLAAWLGSEADPEVLATFEAMHRPEFSLVTIEGRTLDLPTLTRALAGARNAVPGMTIGIEEFEVVIRTADASVVRFLERHSPTSLRRVTAVLVPDEGARHGVRWLSVHETPVA